MWKSSGKWKDLAAKAVQNKTKAEEETPKSRSRLKRNFSILTIQVRKLKGRQSSDEREKGKEMVKVRIKMSGF